MNKTELAKKAHQRAKRRGDATLKEADYYKVLTDIVTVIIFEMISGGVIKIRGFGSLKPSTRKAMALKSRLLNTIHFLPPTRRYIFSPAERLKKAFKMNE